MDIRQGIAKGNEIVFEQLIPLDDCPHPSISETSDLARYEQVFTCVACGKRVAFPRRTIVQAQGDDMVGLILITFGPDWARHYQQRFL